MAHADIPTAAGAPVRPLILIDTAIVGGPGKGLFQFLRSAPQESTTSFEPTIAHFTYPNRGATEFAERARALGLPLVGVKTAGAFRLQTLAALRALARAAGSSLIQSHGYKSHLYAWALRRQTGLPWVAFAHGWTAENLKMRLYHSVDRLVLPSADAVIAVSERLRTTIGRWRKTGPTVEIPNAVTRNDFPAAPGHDLRRELNLPEGAVVIGCLGRFSREKGQDLLLHAFLALAGEYPQAFLLFAGDGPERTRLERLSRTSGLSGRIVFLPHQSAPAALFQAIDLLALPSRSEGLPNVVLEALAFQKPVVAAAVGAVPDVIRDGETGLLVPPNDAAALARALAVVVSDAAARRRLGQNGAAALFPRFCPRRRSRAILAVYRCVTAQRAASPRLSLSELTPNF